MSDTETARDYIALKWGTLKRWDLHSAECKALLKSYYELGTSASAAMTDDTPEQKALICKMIDASNAETIYLDWDGVEVSKEAAKKYVMEYGSK